VAAARERLEEMRRMLEEAGLLGGEELAAYRVVAVERRRRGEMLLREAARIVSERLGVGYEEARRLLLRLIEKGVLEPRI
jgi:hypothetical protein